MERFKIFNTSNAGPFPKAIQENKVTIQILSPVNLNGVRKNYGTIEGYLSKDFSYSSKGTYKDIFNVQDMDHKLLNILSDEAQMNFANYGYLTKKTYVKGESPKVQLEFSVMARNPHTPGVITNPRIVANQLIAMTTPHVSNNSLFLIDRIVGPNVQNPLNKTAVENLKNSDSIYADLINFADSLTSKKPPVCKLTIGNIFKKDMMVVSSVEVTLSKEFYDEGVPMRGDFTVMFESLFDSVTIQDSDDSTEDIFGTGMNMQGPSRVTFDNDVDTNLLNEFIDAGKSTFKSMFTDGNEQ